MAHRGSRRRPGAPSRMAAGARLGHPRGRRPSGGPCAPPGRRRPGDGDWWGTGHPLERDASARRPRDVAVGRRGGPRTRPHPPVASALDRRNRGGRRWPRSGAARPGDPQRAPARRGGCAFRCHDGLARPHRHPGPAVTAPGLRRRLPPLRRRLRASGGQRLADGRIGLHVRRSRHLLPDRLARPGSAPARGCRRRGQCPRPGLGRPHLAPGDGWTAAGGARPVPPGCDRRRWRGPRRGYGTVGIRGESAPVADEYLALRPEPSRPARGAGPDSQGVRSR